MLSKNVDFRLKINLYFYSDIRCPKRQKYSCFRQRIHPKYVFVMTFPLFFCGQTLFIVDN